MSRPSSEETAMSADTVREPEREIPVYARTQVLVVGGGSAGYCAALAAARHGADTLILERCAYLGGMTTGGLVTNRDYAGPDCPYGAVGGIPFEVWERIEAAGGGLRPCPERVGSTDEKDLRYAQLFTTGPRDHAPDAMVLDPEVVKVVAEHSQQAIVNVLGFLNDRDIFLTSLEILEPNLESVFLHLTGKKLRE